MRSPVGVSILLLVCAAATSAQVCEERVSFDVREGTIEMVHDQAPYNCCAWIGFESYQEGQSIDIVEWERFEPSGPCDCICCFDVRVLIGGLEPGEYEVTLTKHLEGEQVEVLGPWIVIVEGTSDPMLIASYLPCVSASVHERLPTTWGVIKSRYR